MICGARGPSPGPRSARATLSPLPRGEGSAPSAWPRYRSSTDEYARLRCVSCFTLGPADGIYAGDVTERSVMAVGGRLPPPLLGVSSLDLAPLAFRRRGLFHFFIVSPADACPGRSAARSGALQTRDRYGLWRSRISGAPLHFVARCTASGTRGLSGTSFAKKTRRPKPARPGMW